MPTQPIAVDYNQNLRQLTERITGVRRAGNFVAHGFFEVPLPRVEVAGAGVVSFPVPDTQIAALTGQASRAPYGRGRETILDESVRKVWQLPPDQVTLGGRSWPDTLARIVSEVSRGLGCEGWAVTAEFYKLLIYDTGGFFRAHRDTEKAPGMFGTLVIVLPSLHEGGELVVRHSGREETVSLSGAEVSELGYVAFFADCEHEVRPITRGNRVCLVYNLIQGPATADNPSPDGKLLTPDDRAEVAATATALTDALGNVQSPPKLVWLLEHHYSPAGLSFAGLKSADAARAALLRRAAGQAGLVIHLGIVHIEESGPAESSYPDYSSRRYRTSAAPSTNFIIVEVSESKKFIDHWRTSTDQAGDLGAIPLGPGELLPAGALDGVAPDEQRLMEASGNEGASFERAYHRAALIVWRQDAEAAVRLQAGIESIRPFFERQVDVCRAPGAPAALRRETIALGRHIIESWQTETRDWRRFPRPSAETRHRVLTAMASLGDAALLDAYLTGVITETYDGTENEALVRALTSPGSTSVAGMLPDLVRRHLPHHPAACAQLLRQLPGARTTSAGNRALATRVAAAVVASLDDLGRPSRDHQWSEWEPADLARTTVASPVVVDVLSTLMELGDATLLELAVQTMIARPELFKPVEVLAPALVQLTAWSPAVETLWRHCVGWLLNVAGQPPAAPTDWADTRPIKSNCKCEPCRELLKFARDPVQRVHQVREVAEVRYHLASQIERLNLDMSTAMIAQGRPQLLVCTKTRRLHQERCNEYRNQIATLRKLLPLAVRAPGDTSAVCAEITAAAARAKRWAAGSGSATDGPAAEGQRPE